MGHRKQKTEAEKAEAQRLADARRNKRTARVRAGFSKQFMRRRLLLIASLHELASVAAQEGAKIGYDGRAPEIIDAPGDGDNPQLRVARNIREHPLDLMFHKRQIEIDQFAAGEIYRRDLEMSTISPMSGARYESIYTVELSNKAAVKEAGLSDMLGPKTFAAKGAKSSVVWNDLRDITLDAMERVNRAHKVMAASAGAGTAEIVTLVAREGLTIQDIAGMSRFGARHSIGRKLQRGLDVLAAHYNLKQRLSGGGAARVHPWHDAEAAAVIADQKGPSV